MQEDSTGNPTESATTAPIRSAADYSSSIPPPRNEHRHYHAAPPARQAREHQPLRPGAHGRSGLPTGHVRHYREGSRFGMKRFPRDQLPSGTPRISRDTPTPSPGLTESLRGSGRKVLTTGEGCQESSRKSLRKKTLLAKADDRTYTARPSHLESGTFGKSGAKNDGGGSEISRV